MTKAIAITVVGSGYVGLVAAVCFAELGHEVWCVDQDQRKINMLQQGEPTIHERFLPELLERHRGERLHFTTDLAEGTRRAQAIFIAVGTPQAESGQADLSYVEAVACEIARSFSGYKVIVEKSTVPVYTSTWIRRVMERHGVPATNFDVASNPEFLREGTAVSDFLHADRIVIGSENEATASLLQEIYAPLLTGEYYEGASAIPGGRTPSEPPVLLSTSPTSAEIIKHASNAFLAMKISFINLVANLCDATGANVEDVANGIGMDKRIGHRFLRPGLGYGGSCFPKDVAALRSVAGELGVNMDLLAEVERINTAQKGRFLAKLRTCLWTLRGKRIGVLGLAFKSETDDIRESPAIEIIRSLLAEGCLITAYDPAAMKCAAEVLPEGPQMSYAQNEYAAARDASAVLILTEWPQFSALDLPRLRRMMQYPIILDGRNVYRLEHMQQHGFTYISVGRPTVTPETKSTGEALPRERA